MFQTFENCSTKWLLARYLRSTVLNVLKNNTLIYRFWIFKCYSRCNSASELAIQVNITITVTITINITVTVTVTVTITMYALSVIVDADLRVTWIDKLFNMVVSALVLRSFC